MGKRPAGKASIGSVGIAGNHMTIGVCERNSRSLSIVEIVEDGAIRADLLCGRTSRAVDIAV